MSIVQVALVRFTELISQRMTLLLLVLVPLVGSLLAGALITGDGHRIPIAIVDEDGSEYSRLVTQRLATRSVLNVTETDRSTAALAVQQHRLEAALVIEPGFEQRLVAAGPQELILILKSPASLSAELAAEYLASEVMRLASNVMAAQEMVREYEQRGALPADRDRFWQEVWDYADAHWEPEPLMQMRYRELAVPGTAPEGAQPLWHQQAIYGLLAALVGFNGLLVSSWLLNDRIQGILRRVATTAVGLPPYLLGTGLAVLVVCLLTLGAGVLGFRYLAGAPLIWNKATHLLLASYLAAVTGLSLAVGTAFENERYWQAATPLLGVVTGVLGAGGHALGSVSERFVHLSRLTPQGWLAAGVQEALMGTGGPAPYYGAVGLLAVGAVGFLTSWWLSLR